MHLCKNLLVFAALASIVGGAAATVEARDVIYTIHTIPSDPNSPVAFVVTLSLQEVVQDDDLVGWGITAARFEQPDDPAMVWTDTSARFSTADGLWWIHHKDPNNPVSHDFVMPPKLAGVAKAQAAVPDLTYDLIGVMRPPSLSAPPYETTAGLTYTFKLVGATEPLAEGEEEPVRVDTRAGT